MQHCASTLYSDLVFSAVEMANQTATNGFNFNDIQSILSAIKEATRETIDEVNRNIDGMKTTIDANKAACEMHHEEVKSDVTSIMEENRRMREMIESHDWEKRKSNMVLFKINECEEQKKISTAELIREICMALGVELGPDAIMEAFRLGRMKGERPILCKLTSFEKKCEILRKNRYSDGESFIIMHDLSKQEREDRKILKPYRDEAHEQGHRVFIRGSKLIIDGNIWTKEELQKRGNGANRVSNEGTTGQRARMQQVTAGRQTSGAQVTPPPTLPQPGARETAATASTRERQPVTSGVVQATPRAAAGTRESQPGPSGVGRVTPRGVTGEPQPGPSGEGRATPRGETVRRAPQPGPSGVARATPPNATAWPPLPDTQNEMEVDNDTPPGRATRNNTPNKKGQKSPLGNNVPAEPLQSVVRNSFAAITSGVESKRLRASARKEA